MTLKEQSGVPTTFQRVRPNTSSENASRQSVGTSSGLHPEDRPYQTNERRHHVTTNRQPIYNDVEGDDALYTTRLPSSARRYAPATTPSRTVMRVTRHKGPPPILRASRIQTQASAYEEPEQTPLDRRNWHFHPLVYVGVAIVVMVIGWIALSNLSQWWQSQQDTWTYGYPRTFQIDADVRHGGMSHFTVENLQGHILIMEVNVSNLAKTHLYGGPTFSGAGADQQPATISFQDVNGDTYPDIILAVGASRYILINDHNAFRPSASTDTIHGKGV